MLKKILIVTDNTREQINGVVTTYTNLEEWAYRDGYSIVYIDPGLYLNCACPGYPEVRLSWVWQIGRQITAVDPDHIHIATEGPLGIAAKLYFILRRPWNILYYGLSHELSKFFKTSLWHS
jgi:hypothetical protein